MSIQLTGQANAVWTNAAIGARSLIDLEIIAIYSILYLPNHPMLPRNKDTVVVALNHSYVVRIQSSMCYEGLW